VDSKTFYGCLRGHQSRFLRQVVSSSIPHDSDADTNSGSDSALTITLRMPQDLTDKKL